MTDKLLDLSAVEPTGHVKLPDGELYPIRSVEDIGTGELHAITRDFRESQRILAADNPGPEELERMTRLLCDLACNLLPDAPRKVVRSLPPGKMMRLVEHFWQVWHTDPEGQTAAG